MTTQPVTPEDLPPVDWGQVEDPTQARTTEEVDRDAAADGN